jgi:hypothetical protein
MSSSTPEDSLYSYILKTYHGVRKRKQTILFKDVPKTMDDLVVSSEGWNPASARINQRNLKKMIGLLSDEARIFLLIKLITYLYIRPFLRLSILVFLILFRCYHSMHPEIISARMNESFLIRSIWSNYYTNPEFLSNTYYPTSRPGIQSNLTSNIKLNLNVSANAIAHTVNVSSNNTILTVSEKRGGAPIQYFNYPYLPLTNSRKQVVFTTNHIVKKLLRPVITSINNTMMLVDFTTPLYYTRPSTRPSTLSKKHVDITPKITSQITISTPMSSLPTKTKKLNMSMRNKNKKQKKNTKRTIADKSTKANARDIIKGNTKLNSIYGYINIDKRIAVVYENGIPYFYKLSKKFLDKYLDA